MGFFVSIRKLNSNFKLQIFQGYFVITCNPLYSTLIGIINLTLIINFGKCRKKVRN